MGLIKVVTAKTNVFSYGIFKHIEIDFADKLNWQITVNILVMFMFIVSNSQNFINKLISCTVPINFSDNQEEYVNEICFIVDKYYTSDNGRILIVKNDSTNILINYIDKDNEQPNLVSYYIFVPYALLIEAILILIPRYLWVAILCKQTQLDMAEIFKASAICKDFSTKNFKNLFLKRRKSILKLKITGDDEDNIAYFSYLLKQLDYYFFRRLDYKTVLITKQNQIKLSFYQRRLCYGYLLIKLLNILNIFFLIFAINVILGIEIHNVFYKSLYDMYLNLKNTTVINDSEDQYAHIQSFYLMNSKYFPLRSTCAFQIRELLLTNTYAVTCSLPINLFNQYIFILLLLWYVILFGFNIHYFFMWCFNFQSDFEMKYAKEQLFHGMKSMNKKFIDSKCTRKCFINPEDNLVDGKKPCKKCEIFLKNFLTQFLDSDALFLFKIISLNSDKILTQRCLVYLYKIYQSGHKHREISV